MKLLRRIAQWFLVYGVLLAVLPAQPWFHPNGDFLTPIPSTAFPLPDPTFGALSLQEGTVAGYDALFLFLRDGAAYGTTNVWVAVEGLDDLLHMSGTDGWFESFWKPGGIQPFVAPWIRNTPITAQALIITDGGVVLSETFSL